MDSDDYDQIFDSDSSDRFFISPNLLLEHSSSASYGDISEDYDDYGDIADYALSNS